MVDDRVQDLLVDGITSDEAVQIALLRNRGFQALFYSIGASRADVVQSGLLTNPSLGFTARFPEGGGRSNLTLTFAQELVDLWQIPVRKRIANAQLARTIDDVVRQGVDLANEVRTRFFRLSGLMSLSRIAEENVDLVQKTIDIANQRLQAGEANILDVNLLRANLVEVKTSLIELERDRQTARFDFARTIGLARESSEWALADADKAEVAPALPDDGELTVFAMEQRLEAKMATQVVIAAEQELRRQYLNVFPSITLGFEGERSERRALPGRNIPADTARASLRQGALTAPDIQTRGERNIERNQIIDLLLGPSLQITLPIWDQNQAQIAKAGYEVERRRREFGDLLDEISTEVRRSAEVARASARLKEYYETIGLPTAESNLDLARKAYLAGEQNIVAVIEAQKFLIAQRLAVVTVDRDYRIALSELRRSLGGRWPAADETQTPTTQPDNAGGGS